MPVVWCFDGEKGTFERFSREMDGQMPYVESLSFSPRDFLYPRTDWVCWTEKAALVALNELGKACPFPDAFTVDGGFSRAGETEPWALAGKAGLCFDVGRGLTERERRALWEAALEKGRFAGVSPPYLSGRGLRLAFRLAIPPLGDRATGVYVLAAQKELMRLGLYRGPLTGRMDGATRRSVGALRRLTGAGEGTTVDGRCWHSMLK